MIRLDSRAELFCLLFICFRFGKKLEFTVIEIYSPHCRYVFGVLIMTHDLLFFRLFTCRAKFLPHKLHPREEYILLLSLGGAYTSLSWFSVHSVHICNFVHYTRHSSSVVIQLRVYASTLWKVFFVCIPSCLRSLFFLFRTSFC